MRSFSGVFCRVQVFPKSERGIVQSLLLIVLIVNLVTLPAVLLLRRPNPEAAVHVEAAME